MYILSHIGDLIGLIYRVIYQLKLKKPARNTIYDVIVEK